MTDIKKECTMAYFKIVPDICAAVQELCGDVPESLNLLELRYCTFKSQYLHVAFMFLMVIVAFYLLGNIADTYLTPVLTKISDALKLSETIAGVTLLAFANGAPDIISSITAADAGEDGDSDGVYIGAGALFGACTFGVTCVLGYCIIKSPNAVKQSRKKKNDIVSQNEKDNIKQKVKQMLHDEHLADMNKMTPTDSFVDSYSNIGDSREYGIESDDKDIFGDLDENGEEAKPRLTLAEFKAIVKEEEIEEDEEVPFSEKSIGGKILFIICWPLDFLGFITIPPVEKEKLDKSWIGIYSITSFLAILLLNGWWDATIAGYKYQLIFGILALVLFPITTYLRIAKFFPALSWIYAVLCLCASIVWLSFAAGVVVDVIEFYSITEGYNKALLSSTLLALGNTLADLFANGSLSSLGFAVMACTGTVAGQFFNLIFGLGINMAIGSKQNPTEFKLFEFGGKDDTGQYLFIVAVITIMLVIIVILASLFKRFTLTRGFAIFLFVMYVLSMSVSIVWFAFREKIGVNKKVEQLFRMVLG